MRSVSAGCVGVVLVVVAVALEPPYGTALRGRGVADDYLAQRSELKVAADALAAGGDVSGARLRSVVPPRFWSVP